ncbi:hypothetical protein JTB14_000728 [Gonioctena quinquepunctata]|nr:hypothetical protein JTB14_000728 [Gonioctena quinquepunctata]
MDNIYGDRPNSTVPDSEATVDTGNDFEFGDSLELNETAETFVEAIVHEVPTDFQREFTPVEVIIVDENATHDPQADDSKENKHGKINKMNRKGKKSYSDQIEVIQKNTLKVLSEFCESQSKVNAEIMKSENEKQREWESELLEREHAFQQSQMEMLLRTFQYQQMPPIPQYSYVPHVNHFSRGHNSGQTAEVNDNHKDYSIPSTSKKGTILMKNLRTDFKD